MSNNEAEQQAQQQQQQANNANLEQQQQDDDEEEEEDDERDAFLDLNDPENQILDDGTTDNQKGNDDDDDDEEGDHDFVTINTEDEQMYQGQPVADKDPARDDAFLVFVADSVAVSSSSAAAAASAAGNNDDNDDDNDGQKSKPQQQQEGPRPLHAIAVHPTDPTIVVCAGEDEFVHVVRLPNTIPVRPVVDVQQNSGAAAAAAASSTEEQQTSAATATIPDPTQDQQNIDQDTKFKQQDASAIPEQKRWNAFAKLAGHTDTITKMAFAPTGKQLATAGMDGKIRLWHTDMTAAEPSTAVGMLAKELNDLEGEEIESLLWHPTGLMIAAGSSSAQIVLWNAVKGTAAQYLGGHRDAVTCLAWSNEVKRMISASADGSVILQNPKTAANEVTVTKGIADDEGVGITSMVVWPVSPSSASSQKTQQQNAADEPPPVVLVGCADGTLALVHLHAPKGKVVKKVTDVHSQAIEALSMPLASEISNIPGLFGVAQSMVASCSCDCKIALWSVPDFTLHSVINVGEGITSLCWRSSVVVCACLDGDVRMYDSRAAAVRGTNSNGMTEPTVHLMGHRRLVLDVAVARTSAGAVVVTVADDGSARAFSIADM